MRSAPRTASLRVLPYSAREFNVAFGILIFAFVGLRIGLWRYINNSDLLTSFVPWQSYILQHGRWHALQHPLGIYFPAYFDLTVLTSYLDGHHVNRINQIKLISFCFDLLAAYIAYALVSRIVRDLEARNHFSLAPKIAALSILAGPTVLINGSAWGQTDIVYTTLLLLSTYAVIAGSGAAAALFFGFALAFKLQAVFLVPFLGAMLLARRIRWIHLLLVPVGWILSLIPCILAGGTLREFLMLPFTQGDKFPVLAINIGNPWTALMLLHFNERLGTLLGIAITVAVTIVISVWGSRAVFQTPTNTLMLASFSLLVLPYVMPRMHDRYFFAAEVFLCILSCIDLDFWFPAALVLSASLISYSNYFLYHVRYLVLLPALLANTAALWLALRLVRLRVGLDQKPALEDPLVNLSS